MSDMMRCPDCGRENPAGSDSCAACNFPLKNVEHVPGTKPAPGAGSGSSGEGSAPPVIPRPVRPRRPRPASNQSLTLWLVFGTILALVVIYIAVKANTDRASQPVAGAAPVDQRQVDDLRAALDRDSTDVESRVKLADILYNTGNWSEAILHYRSAVHRDSTRIGAVVDMGVCYYNLGNSPEAERLFNLALARDPHHSVALFNLGVVNESRKNPEEALKFYHRALQSEPTEEMRQGIMAAMQRIMQQLGKTAPPLDGMTAPPGGGAAPPGGR